MLQYYFELAIRSLKRDSVLVGLMILAIAVGVGSSMSFFSVMRLLAGDPMPRHSEDIHLVQLDYRPLKTTDEDAEPPLTMSYIDASALLSARMAAHQAAMVAGTVTILPGDANQAAFVTDAWYTTADFFPMFRVPMKYGRSWDIAEDTSHARIAIISASLNNRLFGGADSVGQTLNLKGNQFRIIGVMSEWRPTPKFYNVSTSKRFARPEDVFIPLEAALDSNLALNGGFNCYGEPPDLTRLKTSDCGWLTFWVGFDTSSQKIAYTRYLRSYASNLHSAGVYARSPNERLRGIVELMAYLGIVPKDVRIQVWVAFGFLLVCIVNSIGLLLAKFMRAAGTVSLRRALGATRQDIFLQHIVECTLVGVLGGLAGVGFALLGTLWMQTRSADYANLVHLDGATLLMTVLAAILASVAAGLLPTWKICQVPPAQHLKGG